MEHDNQKLRAKIETIAEMTKHAFANNLNLPENFQQLVNCLKKIENLLLKSTNNHEDEEEETTRKTTTLEQEDEEEEQQQDIKQLMDYEKPLSPCVEVNLEKSLLLSNKLAPSLFNMNNIKEKETKQVSLLLSKENNISNGKDKFSVKTAAQETKQFLHV